MILTTISPSLNHSCRSCTNCDEYCVIYSTSTATVMDRHNTTSDYDLNWTGSEQVYTFTFTKPDDQDYEPEPVYINPVDREIQKMWRQLMFKRGPYKNRRRIRIPVKRKILFSKSGWVAKKGYLKKKGKLPLR